MKNPSSKLTRIRLDLEEFDFDVEYVKGKQNVIADALSRIKITSDELKTINVITRSMSKNNAQNNDNNNQLNISQPDQLRMFNALSFEEVLKLPKLQFNIKEQFNSIRCSSKIKNKTGKTDLLSVRESQINSKEDVALVHLFQNIEESALKLNIEKLALPTNDEIFNYIPVEEIKKAANKAIKSIEILLYDKPTILNDPNMISEILEKTHNTPTGGHIGQTKMYTKLRREFYWKNIKQTIIDFVNECKLCKLNKHQKPTNEKFIKTTTPFKPFEIISIDTVGPFQKTNKNNRYAVTIQCDFSKYVTIIPIINKEAPTVAKAVIEQFMLTYGTNIKAIRTDMGTEYKNELFDSIRKILQFEHKFSTPYHPQTIGALERNHKCLNEYLRIFTNEHNNDWDEWVNYYAFAFNTTPNLEHGYTPFELVFGKTEKIQNQFLTDTVQPIYNYDDYSKELQYRLHTAHKRTRKYMETSKQKTLDTQNKTNPVNLKLGDQVAIINENRRKLEPVYKGPFTVTNPNVIITNNQGTNQEIHKNRLIKL